MYLLIPFLFLVIPAAGIAYIVHRKMPYLRKLTPEAHEFGDSVLHDFFPEVAEHINQATIKQYQASFLKELEKLARRWRVVTLKMDHLSDRLIKKLRHSHISTHLEHQALLQEQETVVEPPVTPEANTEPTMDDLRAQEQQLIIQIAQNPKEFALYDQLGDLYLAMDNEAEARESFEAALALNPHDPVVARKYSQLLKKAEASV